LNEWNVILIYYVMDILKYQKLIFFKSPFKYLKFIILKNFLLWYFLYVLQHHDLKLEMEKKRYVQYHLNIHILSQFSTTLENDFEKGSNLSKLWHPNMLCLGVINYYPISTPILFIFFVISFSPIFHI
jgi:hypothetical protein